MRSKYLIAACALALTIGGANATTFDWSITSEFENGSGTLVASGSGGALTVTSILGTIATGSPYGPFDITGLLTPGTTYASITHVPGDNLLFYPAAPLVDSNGIVFSTFQALFPVESFMDIVFTEGHYSLLVSNSGASGITFSVLPEISSTPLPATWLMMLTGLGVLGLLGWRSRHKATALAAA